MKKIILLIITTLAYLGNIQSQELDFNSKIDTSLNNSKTLNISIEIIGGEALFTAYILNDAPYNGGKIVAYGKQIEARKYSFQDIALKSFYVCVTDSKKSISCKKNTKLVPINQ
jgi:hypothetical protein